MLFKSLMGKRVHRPSNSDSHQQKQEERPENVLDPVFWLTAAQKAESNGNDRCEKQERLDVREIISVQQAHALRPRAAS